MTTLRIAIRALLKNKMRAGLTVLGLVIGIAAVTTMVSIGQSAGQLIQNQFKTLGTNVIVVMPKRSHRGGVRQGSMPTLTAEDSEAITEDCPAVLASSPLIGAGGQVINGNDNWNPKEMFGVGADYLLVRNWDLRLGGFFAERDIDASEKVCVIGQTVAEKLFQTTNPVGETIRIRNIPFRVIGVLVAKGANIVGDDQDDVLLMPYTTVRKRLYGSSFKNVHAIMVSARSVKQMSVAEEEIRLLLADRHKIAIGQPDDFQVQNTTEIANILGTITGTMTAMLASIAGISLLVGGVGIMNIMLVSVTERTREIGIRMAVGARSRDILLQFLVESVLLSTIGGVIGFILGVAGSAGIITLINTLSPSANWPLTISLPAAAIAILFAGGVGVFFGFYPARQASRLDPIDALRYE
ncbi:MAG: ABC transporter permease [Planctomycetaceae bacterium]|nr:ABC transporter permease [Planctomycetaceae bacterium]